MGGVCDLIEDIYKNVKNWIGDVVNYVIHAVKSAVDWVVRQVIKVWEYIEDHWVEIVVVLAAVVFYVYGVGIITAVSELADVATVFVGNIYVYIDVYAQAFGAFLEAIHFTTILAIHNIAYLLSADYRMMINKIWSQVGQVSAALGLGAGFMILALRNARTVVMDVSSMMGMKYDLAEITWMNELSGFLTKFQVSVKQYENNPGLVLQQIDDWITKNYVDTKGSVQQVLWQTLDSWFVATENIIGDVTTIRNDVIKLAEDLPEFIREKVLPKIQTVTDHLDEFISDRYNPAADLLDQTINILKGRQEQAVSDLGSITDRLLRPADYLHEIDSFSDVERFAQERSLAEITTRGARRNASASVEATSNAWAGLMKIREALGRPVTKVAWLIPEAVKPGRPALAEVVPGATWFVGDY